MKRVVLQSTSTTYEKLYGDFDSTDTIDNKHMLYLPYSQKEYVMLKCFINALVDEM